MKDELIFGNLKMIKSLIFWQMDDERSVFPNGRQPQDLEKRRQLKSLVDGR
jgi:hypothetical protein